MTRFSWVKSFTLFCSLYSATLQATQDKKLPIFTKEIRSKGGLQQVQPLKKDTTITNSDLCGGRHKEQMKECRDNCCEICLLGTCGCCISLNGTAEGLCILGYAKDVLVAAIAAFL